MIQALVIGVAVLVGMALLASIGWYLGGMANEVMERRRWRQTHGVFVARRRQERALTGCGVGHIWQQK